MTPRHLDLVAMTQMSRLAGHVLGAGSCIGCRQLEWKFNKAGSKKYKEEI